jgi:hypothetical protein
MIVVNGEYFDLLVIALAAWRVAVLVTMERGPFSVMLRLRERFGVVHDDEDNVAMLPSSGIGKLLTCVWCFSFYTVVGIGAISFFDMRPVFLLAAWGIVVIIQKLVFGRD